MLYRDKKVQYLQVWLAKMFVATHQSLIELTESVWCPELNIPEKLGYIMLLVMQFQTLSLGWRLITVIASRITGPHFFSFVRGILPWPAVSPHKGTITRKRVPFYEVLMVKEVILQFDRVNVASTSRSNQISNELSEKHFLGELLIAKLN